MERRVARLFRQIEYSATDVDQSSPGETTDHRRDHDIRRGLASVGQLATRIGLQRRVPVSEVETQTVDPGLGMLPEVSYE